MEENGSAIANTKLVDWNSPIPYVYAGLGLVMGLITKELMFLACSPISSSSSSSRDLGGDHRKHEKHSKKINILSIEPSFVVIMAGHEAPTCLEKPIASSCHDQA